MTLLSETSRSEWVKEGCLICENRMHPCKTCYDDIPDLQGVNIVTLQTDIWLLYCQLQITFKYSQQATFQSKKNIFMLNFSVVYYFIYTIFHC